MFSAHKYVPGTTEGDLGVYLERTIGSTESSKNLRQVHEYQKDKAI